jgi:hypothetical protein
MLAVPSGAGQKLLAVGGGGGLGVPGRRARLGFADEGVQRLLTHTDVDAVLFRASLDGELCIRLHPGVRGKGGSGPIFAHGSRFVTMPEFGFHEF